MKKRDFKASSIFILYLLFALVSAGIYIAFINYQNPAFIIVAICTALIDFAVCRGLLVKRMGSVGDYFGQIKHIGLNFVLVNIFLGVVGFLINKIAGLAGDPSLASASGNLNISKDAYGFYILSLVLSIGFSLITNYANFVVGDPRNKDLSVLEAFKKVFSTGIKLLGKTLKSMLIYLLLPILALIFLYIIFVVFLARSPGVGTVALGFILLFALVVCIIYFAIKFKGVVSDHYLNLYGDIESSSDLDDNYEDQTFYLNRKVEVSPDDIED